MRKGLVFIFAVAFLSGCFQMDAEPSEKAASFVDEKRGSVLIAKETIELKSQEEVSKNVSGVEAETGLFIVDNPTSYQVYINKNRRLPEGYTPLDLVEPKVSHLAARGDDRRLLRVEPASKLEELFEAAQEEGIDLVAVSGYRSHQRQATIYQSHVARNGQEYADRFSARPGTSEHETGLTIDVSAASVAFALEQAFRDTTEGSWLAENAHLYGFIIRYPEGKEAITGYAYEPWHLRYVGEELAQHLYEEELTLEEYFGYHYELND